MSEERKYTGFAAIYQLEQEKLKREKAQPSGPPAGPAVVPGEELSPDASQAEERREAFDVPRAEETEARADGPVEPAPSQATAPPVGETVRDLRPAPAKTSPPRAPRRGAAAKTVPRSVPAPGAADSSVEAHAVRWKQVYRLNKGETNVMKVMFGLSHARGTDTCYIKVGEVAEAARLKKRRCQYVIRSLETLGFLERLGEYDPSNRLGLQYRVYLKPVRADLE